MKIDKRTIIWVITLGLVAVFLTHLNSPVTAYKRADYIKLIYNTDHCFTDCYAIIEINNPTSQDFTLNKNNWKTWYIKDKEANDLIDRLRFQILKDIEYEVTVPDYINITKSIKCSTAEKIPSSKQGRCYTKTTNINNKSNKDAAEDDTALIWMGKYDNFNAETNTFHYTVKEKTGSHKEKRTRKEYINFNPPEKTIKAGETYRIKILGKKKPKLGPNNIDWKIKFMDYEPDWAWWNSSYNYSYRLNISLSGASYPTHVLQPVTLDISDLNGMNKPALAVAYNNSGVWVEQSWEWFHQRGDTEYDDVIRFLANCTENIPQTDYWIYTTDDASLSARNSSLFKFYDGFEVGDLTGYAEEIGSLSSYGITSSEKFNGDYALHHTTSSWDMIRHPVGVLDSPDIYVAYAIYLETNSLSDYVIPWVEDGDSSNAFAFGLFPLTGGFIWHDGRFHTAQASYALDTWYTISLRHIDTTGSDAVGDYYINRGLSSSGIGPMGTVTAIGYVASYLKNIQYVDEIYASEGVEFNLYPVTPVVTVGLEEVNENVSAGVIETSSGDIMMDPASNVLVVDGTAVFMASGISLRSPDGSWFCCGPNNGGAWVCSGGKCS